MTVLLLLRKVAFLVSYEMGSDTARTLPTEIIKFKTNGKNITVQIYV